MPAGNYFAPKKIQLKTDDEIPFRRNFFGRPAFNIMNLIAGEEKPERRFLENALIPAPQKGKLSLRFQIPHV